MKPIENRHFKTKEAKLVKLSKPNLKFLLVGDPVFDGGNHDCGEEILLISSHRFCVLEPVSPHALEGFVALSDGADDIPEGLAQLLLDRAGVLSHNTDHLELAQKKLVHCFKTAVFYARYWFTLTFAVLDHCSLLD